MESVANLQKRWERHRQVLQEVLEKIDDEYLHFSPWDGGMPLSALVIHLTGSTDMFLAKVQNKPYTSSAPVNAHSMDELRRYLNQATEKTLQSFRDLSAENLEMTIEMNEMKDTGANWISTAIDHEIHHKGQIFTYARIVGVDSLPFFITKP
ncbi:DinB family protein [Peribacillus sp. FSL H8-0477]|uniref:DinB family protein n=1 Tax=Peribacillus sp. FSL H8-0477 TaxID=2921388 RepID=UPI0030F68CBE